MAETYPNRFYQHSAQTDRLHNSTDIATMPTMHGESAVIRLLRKGSGFVTLDQVGLAARDDAILRNALQAPFGMIIVTGPTGSGKTTTLAASLAVINEPMRKILTIEDPIEYHIKGINQTQVHPAIGLTFAAALRSFLRQDPDVIMVGEVRDAETASQAVQAALTGHMVLTTLHTSDTVGAVARLRDLGVPSFLIGATLTGVVAQTWLAGRPIDLADTPRGRLLGAPAPVMRFNSRAPFCGLVPNLLDSSSMAPPRGVAMRVKMRRPLPPSVSENNLSSSASQSTTKSLRP